MTLFTAGAIVGFRFNLWVVVVGFALHGVFDSVSATTWSRRRIWRFRTDTTRPERCRFHRFCIFMIAATRKTMSNTPTAHQIHMPPPIPFIPFISSPYVPAVSRAPSTLPRELVECNGRIGTTWLGLNAASFVAPPQNRPRYSCVGAPCSRRRSSAPSGSDSAVTLH